MDHLVGPGIDAPSPRGFRVKKICDENLIEDDREDCRDGAKSFHKFPDSKGWKLTRGVLIPEDARESGVEEWATAPDSEKDYLRSKFVQRWLFFGLLRAIFWEDDNFDYTHFIERNSTTGDRITTRRLNDYLLRWADGARLQGAHDNRARVIRHQAVLQRAREIVSNHCAVNVPALSVNWAINPTVAFSLIILGESLSRAFAQFYTFVPGWKDPVLANEHWGYSSLVLKKLEEKIQCRREIAAIHAFFHGNAVGPLLALFNVGFFENHHSCLLPERCTHYSYAQQIDPTIAHQDDSPPGGPANPSPRHQKELHNKYEDCCLVRSDATRLAEIIRENKVPLLTFNDPGSNNSCTIEPSNLKEHRYLVFSHVWVDRFGNKNENAIHKCVFDFLRVLRDGLGERQAPKHFWLDTLGLPVGEEHQRERNLGIKKIHEIYRRATWTIVLDEILLQETMDDCTQAAIRISVSRWMSRLWTLQEAFLSENLFFAFKSEGHPVYQTYSMENIQRGLDEVSRNEHEHQHRYISEVASSYRERILFGWRSTLLQQNFNPVHGQNLFADRRFVADAWKAVQFRRSGSRADEALALAILFNLDVTELPDNQEDSSQAECDRRMEVILKQLARVNGIPPGIIFVGGPRLNRTGFRWAPQSWLSSAPIVSPHPLDHQYSLNPSSLSFEPSRNDDEMQGLQVQFPGFMLYPMSTPSSHENMLSNDMSIQFPAGYDTNNSNNWFRIEKADQQDDYEMRDGVERPNLAIIALTLEEAYPRTIALLVAVESQISHHIVVKVLCRIWLMRMQASDKVEELKTNFHQDFVTHFCAERKPPNTRWCVVGRGPEPDPTPAANQFLQLSRRTTFFQMLGLQRRETTPPE